MAFQDSLLSINMELQGKSIIIAGDFNTMKSSMEKRGGSIITNPFREKLEDLMGDLYILDPMPKNGKYTWNKKWIGLGHIATRIDHFLVSTFLLQKYLLMSSYIISSTTFEHKPISLSLSPLTNISPIPFIFNPIWIHNVKTLDIIHSTWNSTFSCSPSFIWESKPRAFCFALKNWATSSFMDPSIIKNNL